MISVCLPALPSATSPSLSCVYRNPWTDFDEVW